MSRPSILPTDRTVYDTELLKSLLGTRLARQLQVLCVIGAHRFDELPLIDRIFPSLRRIYLFEPQPAPLQVLRDLAARDARITVFPVAVSDADGTARFHVASNSGESSSLLALGSHRELFPEVTIDRVVEVPTRRLDSVLREHQLPAPDLLLIDVQGAEHLVLKSLPPSLLQGVRLIYTEVSTEAVYESAGLMKDVEALLVPRFVNVGFAAIRPGVPVHGNAVFVAQDDVPAVVSLSLPERLRRAFHRLRRRLRGR
ncbi:FkbM family methyltransferase [Aquabacterium sp. J223]|uniref:FkbM family methyltransferase n=1 Tax=Aquabacterium sp. J223 TaxID=2898431 RepID=UPI0021ADE866|nr:FkbM family methyltransferase [Aquabacterium sp. J223]UUX97508.1 FkbM family methyltransferase [Aquabacterium sp. J223]